MTKNDYEDIISACDNPQKIEMLVQGSVELMKTRYPILYGNEQKRNYENCLIDANSNSYPIHKSISGEELTIFDSQELSLVDEIAHLKKIGFCNFSIDGRYKDDDYYKIIDIYKKALKGEIHKNELSKYSPKNTTANY